MILYIDGHPFHYEMEKLCGLFLPNCGLKVLHEPADPEQPAYVYTGLRTEGGALRVTTALRLRGERQERVIALAADTTEGERERRMAVELFELLCQACGHRPKWGMLTGVRPVKLLRRMMEQDGEQAGLARFQRDYLVSPEKARLARATMHGENRVMAMAGADTYSLYASIPFCPTRCSYCSFVSSSVEKTAKLVPQYLELLLEELRATARLASELGLRLTSVYIGGGTPTTLNAEQLAALLHTINNSFDLKDCAEFTVEAGRPDTITREKLAALKSGGATRVSINPQTLSDKVLETIGRKHTSAQTLDAFALARETGFDSINMDLIAGLPGDDPRGFAATVDGVLDLEPENITVHTLSLKRAARIFQEEPALADPEAAMAAEMLDYAGKALFGAGYAPYYLYRQSRMVGNLENTGWAKPGFESTYNVFIMDECQTILACGAGAATKVMDPRDGNLERIFNVKYPYEYISRFSEMLTRKEQVKTLYESFRGVHPL